MTTSFITKSDFRKIVSENNRQFGKTIEIGDIVFNEGLIYNPRYNGGRAFDYVGADGLEKKVNYLWRKAKENGGFVFDHFEYVL